MIFAGVNDKAKEFYNAGLLDIAKELLLKEKKLSATDNAERNYYLGLICDNEKNDSAKIFFQQAITFDAKYPYGYIGMGRVYLKNNDEKEAEKQLKQAEKLGKKNAEVQVHIAQAYFDYGKTVKAQDILSKAQQTNMDYSPIYLLQGDMKMKENNIGEATAKYESALYFNDKDKLAYIKLANIYTGMGRLDLSLQNLNAVLAFDANYVPANILLGDINISQYKYKNAIEAYDKVIKFGNAPIKVYERYAQALYFDKQYNKSLEQIQNVLKDEPQNIVMNRLKAYNEFELENYEQATTDMQNFLSMMPQKSIIYFDYITMANLYIKSKKYVEAIENFKKAIELNDKNPNIIKELANAYYLSFNYENAAINYEKYFMLNPNYLAMDLYMYADACKNSADFYLQELANNKKANKDKITLTTDELNVNYNAFKLNIDKAISANDSLIKRAPDSYLGFYGKAKCFSDVDDYEYIKTDKMAGTAKPLFEEAIKRIETQNGDGNLNTRLIECWRYFSIYYIRSSDVKNTIEVNKKIVAIDPTDAVAINVLKTLKVKGYKRGIKSIFNRKVRK
jgi:tetratricopeptide (TPR) repeat protein